MFYSAVAAIYLSVSVIWKQAVANSWFSYFALNKRTNLLAALQQVNVEDINQVVQ